MAEAARDSKHPAPSHGFGRELAVLIVLFAGATAFFGLYLYPKIGWPGTAPMPGRSLLLALAILALVVLRGQGPGSIGLGRPRWIWLAILLGLAFVALKLFAIQPAGDWVKESLNVPPADYSFFADIRGNAGLYAFWLSMAWLAGGFAEEIIFRGYLMTRIAGVLGDTRIAWIVAVFAQAILFGLGHYYQGYGAVLSIAFTALISGLFFLIAGRNLWPLILAHGLWDSLGFTAFYIEGIPPGPGGELMISAF